MPGAQEQLRALTEARLNTWSQAQELLDRAVQEKRGMTEEENTQYERMTADLDRYDNTIEKVRESEVTQRELENVNEEFRRAATPDERSDWERRDEKVAQDIRSLLRSPGSLSLYDQVRAVNSMDFDMIPTMRAYEAARNGSVAELRVLQGDGGASGGSLTIPTTVASTVYAFITNSLAMRRIARIIPTASGNPMTFPRVATHSVATQVASQVTTLAGTDSVLGAMTLNAFDYAELVAVANDFLDDSGTDVLGFIGEQLGRAIAQVIGKAYVTGGGSTAPQGIEGAGAVGNSGTIATGGSLILGPGGNHDPSRLIDLQYSIADGYNGRLAWLFRRETVAVLRKMRDGAGGTQGQFLWQPSQQYGLIPGEPDRFLGDPVYSDPNVASMASDAKIGYYGDWTAFYIRDVGTFRIERSDDIYFDKNQVAFRGIWRTDSDLIDTTAINTLHQVVT